MAFLGAQTEQRRWAIPHFEEFLKFGVIGILNAYDPLGADCRWPG